MRILITGADGFIGSHLVEYIKEIFPEYEIYGTKYESTVDISEYSNKLNFIYCDMRNKEQVTELLKISKPDRIFHLAAQSYPTVSWKDPVFTLESNVIGTTNLFESIIELGLNPIVFVACSSAEYGFVSPEDVPVKENRILKPLHPYGVSKVGQEGLSYQYFKNKEIRTVIARIFNTTGPRKVKDVMADFSQQVARIEKGIQEPFIRVGNLEAERDITDVRDQVRSFWMAMDRVDYGEPYNFCSNIPIRIQYILDKLISLSKKEIKIEIDETKLRPSDEPIILGDNSKITKATGWKPEINIDKTILDSLNYWRKKF